MSDTRPLTGGARDGSPSPAGDHDELGSLPAGTVLGRYVVLSRLGAGGAGSVYAAYDTQIDRRVALKVLHAADAEDGATWSAHWARIVREARILGKLSHPNVVTLYDVETIDDVSFIAMELVAGTDLAAWTESPRPWPQVVATFLQAARGLAAAHAAGIVHGDFKPANLLLGEDGRARVSDFGVARVGLAAEGGGEASTAPTRVQGRHVSVGTTAGSGSATMGTGAGTPFYMAPEQHDGLAPDARADVYAFCVALHEALVGARPFRATTIQALALEKREGPPPIPAGARAVPGWLRELLARGMAPAPADRIASMDTIIAALARPRSGRWQLAAVAGMAVLLGSLGAAAWLGGSTDEPCTGAERHLDGVWDERRRAGVRDALLATEVAYASDAWERVRDGLDAYAEGWTAAHTEACRATQLGEQSGELLDLRVRCLDKKLARLGALVDVLEEPADAELVRKAPEGLAALEPVAQCADADRLSAGPQPPDDPRVAEVEAALDRSSAYGAVGKFREARAASESGIELAEALGFQPLLAETLLELGSTQAHTGEAAAAEETLERAHWMAEKVGHDEVAATAALWLVYVVGDLQRRFDAGAMWGKHADAAIARAGDDPLDRAQLLLNVGTIDLNAAHHDAAQEAYEAALEIRERELGPEHADVAVVLGALGNLAAARKRYEAAEQHYQRSLAIKRKHLGDRHPSLGLTWMNLGVVARNRGRYAEARERYEAAKTLWEETLGPRHPQIAIVLNNLGTLAGREGDHRAARDAFTKACEIWQETLDESHPDIAMCLMNLSEAERNLGALGRARELGEKSLRLREARLGPEHPDLAGGHVALGDLELSADAPAAALTHYEAAREIWSEALPDDPDRAYALVGIGRAHIALGHPHRAIEPLESAVALWTAAGTEASLVAAAQFHLARALSTGGASGDTQRALELARAAQGVFVDAGPSTTDEAAEVAAWLAARQ